MIQSVSKGVTKTYYKNITQYKIYLIICDLFVYENFAGIKISRVFFKMPCPTLFYMLQDELDRIICIKALNMTERWSIDGFDESFLYDCRNI